jgi:hypothetical protein
MWHITYKSFNSQDVLAMALMNSMDAEPCTKTFDPAGEGDGAVSFGISMGSDDSFNVAPESCPA